MMTYIISSRQEFDDMVFTQEMVIGNDPKYRPEDEISIYLVNDRRNIHDSTDEPNFDVCNIRLNKNQVKELIENLKKILD